MNDPLYKQVSESLLRDIQNGKYRPGQKLPSETALVQRFETSRITIGRALRELKQLGLIAGVAGSGNFVKASAASSDGHLFGLLIPNLGETEIFEPICQGMAASQSLLWGNTAGNQTSLEQQALQLCHQYIARGASGVFFAPLELTPKKDEVNLEICSLLDAARIPVVLLDRCIMPFPHRSKYDLVGIDNRRAGYLATEHLLDLRCRSIAFLALSGAAPTVEARIAGYREALFTRGMEFAPHRVQRLTSVTTASFRQALTSTRAHAFVCANDRLAGQFLQALQELGRRVPQDIRVVGIDDVEYARMLPVPLTTIHQPCRAIGEMAITAMLTRMEKPDMAARDILLDCRLVVRKSSGA